MLDCRGLSGCFDNLQMNAIMHKTIVMLPYSYQVMHQLKDASLPSGAFSGLPRRCKIFASSMLYPLRDTDQAFWVSFMKKTKNIFISIYNLSSPLYMVDVET